MNNRIQFRFELMKKEAQQNKMERNVREKLLSFKKENFAAARTH